MIAKWRFGILVLRIWYWKIDIGPEIGITLQWSRVRVSVLPVFGNHHFCFDLSWIED